MVDFLSISGWAGTVAGERLRTQAWRLTPPSVTPDPAPLWHFSSFYPGICIEWSCLGLSASGAHFPCPAPSPPCYKKVDSLKSPLNPRPEPRTRLLSGRSGVLPLSLSLQHCRLTAPRHPCSPHTALGPWGQPCSSQSGFSSGKSRAPPAAQRPAAPSPPWASSPPLWPALQPPSCGTALGPPDLGHQCREARETTGGCVATTPPLPLPPPRGCLTPHGQSRRDPLEH